MFITKMKPVVYFVYEGKEYPLYSGTTSVTIDADGDIEQHFNKPEIREKNGWWVNGGNSFVISTIDIPLNWKHCIWEVVRD